MRGEEGRTVRVRGRIAEHGMPVSIERVEPRVRVPGFVEVQAIDGMARNLDHARHVVGQAVVGRIRDDRVSRFLELDVLRERVRLDPGPHGLRPQVFCIDGTDDAVPIAVRHQEDGNRAGHRQTVLDGLVTVAIAERNVVLRQAAMNRMRFDVEVPLVTV